MAEEGLRTRVWLLHGMSGSTPGILELVNGRIGFTTDEGRVFESALGEVAVNYPWYYFGGGCKISRGDQTYRISFVRPNGAMDVSDGLLGQMDDGGGGGVLALLTAGRKMQDIGEGRKAGKVWKA